MNDNIEPQIHGLYCKTAEATSEHAGLVRMLEQLRCDLLRKKAEALQSKKEFKKAAHCTSACSASTASAASCDEVLYNASINFEAARCSVARSRCARC